MATGNIDYNAVLADLEARKAQTEAAIAAVKNILASAGVITNGGPEGAIRPENIPTHAFLSLSIAEATKKYLGMVKSKQTVPQIMQALERGGLPPATYSTVYAVLRRRENQVKDILRIGDEWALTEWYPNNPNLRKRPEKSKRKRKAKKRVKVAGTTAAASATPTKEPSITMVDAAAKILSEANGPLHAKVIAESLKKFGKNTTSGSLAGSLVQDAKKRFKNIGENTWELAEK